jgi:type I restriction enzyme M protein
MEHAKNFAKLAENFVAEFPDLDKFYLYIHILGYVSGFDKPLFFNCHSGIAPIISHFNFDKETLLRIEKSSLFSINQLSEEERKDLCKYLLELCLQIEREVENAPENPKKVFDDLSVSDPHAVSKSDGNYLVNFSELSAQSKKRFIDWDIEQYFYYKTPKVSKQISKKIVEFAEPKSSQTVYDPNCGDGSLFVEFYNKFLDAEFNFNGVVGNQFERLFCLVNFYVNGILDDKRIEFEIEVSSPLEDTPQWYYEMRGGEDYSLREKVADIAVSFAPSKSQLTDGERDSRFFALSHSLEQPEYAYIELMLNAVRDTGKAIAIVPDSILYSAESRFFREAYLSRDWIESVISLPENSFDQNDLPEFSIVVFNKNKTEKGIVIFDGEGSEFERTEIKNDLILSENDIDLRAARYALKEIKSIRNIIERHQERNSENSFVSSTENVALNQYFDNLAETFSEKFPTVKNTVYLYLLVVVMMILDRGNQWLIARKSFLINPRIYDEIESHIYGEYYKQITDVVLGDLANKGLSLSIKVEDLILGDYGIQTESPYKDAFRELCKYLIGKCLQIEGKVKFRDVESLWKEIAKRESNAIKLKRNGESTIDFSKFSDGAYQEYSEAIIAQSFSFEENYLQLFDRIDETLAKIANPKPNQQIFNPNCGIGSLFVELQNQFPNHNLRFTGRVEDSFFYILCKANLLAHNIEATIIQEEILDADLEITFFDENPDIAFGIVPLGLELLGRRDKKFFPLSHKRKNVEYSFTELLIKSLNEIGKAIVVVPEKFLYAGHAKGFKKEYLENDWVESVISLSEDAFGEYGSIKASIIVFNKNKAEKGFITFKSLDSRFEETRVNLDEILSSGSLDLRVNRYASKEVKELKSILSKYPQDEVKKIEDLVVLAISGFNYSPNNRIVENSSETLPYVRVKDLSNNDKDFTFDISKVERKISPEKVTHKRNIIDFSAVLVSKIAPNLKPTLFNFTGQPIVIGSDVIALKVKEDVNVEYFLTQLYSQLVKIQVEMMSSGNTINRISTQDFLNIRIILPPLDEQQRQVSAILDVIEEKVIAEEKLIDAQYEVVANINHSLKNKLAVIINDYDTLVRFLRRKERNSGTISFDDPISANAVGDDIDTIEIITDRLKMNLLDASKVFKNAEKIQKQTLKKDVVELVKFFRNEVKSLYAGKNYSIDIIAKPNLKLNVWLDKDAFKDVIENLIENAKSHGFIDETKSYRIVFELSKLKDSEEVDEKTSTQYARIVYKNDGKPFPKNFSFEDYKQFSNKAGKTQGTGIGGYVINKMIDLHDGRFNFIAPSDDFTVEFEILLPLED